MRPHPALDLLFHALAEPSRRTIVDRLGQGPAAVSELARPMGISLAAVVQHVQVLEQAGLVRTRKVGRVRQCALDRRGLDALDRWVRDRKALWERRLDRLGALLDDDTSDPSDR